MISVSLICQIYAFWVPILMIVPCNEQYFCTNQIRPLPKHNLFQISHCTPIYSLHSIFFIAHHMFHHTTNFIAHFHCTLYIVIAHCTFVILNSDPARSNFPPKQPCFDYSWFPLNQEYRSSNNIFQEQRFNRTTYILSTNISSKSI